MSAELSGAEALVAQGATVMKIETDALCAVAIQRPRNLAKIQASVIAEIDSMPHYAEDNYYTLEFKNRNRGEDEKDIVQGPSIGLARIIARHWGNCSVRVYVFSETEDAVHLSGVFMDLETNYRVERPFIVSRYMRRRDGSSYLLGGFHLSAAVQAAVSKCERNVIQEGISGSLFRAAYDRSRSIAADSTRKNLGPMIDFFEQRGVLRANLEEYLGVKLEKLSDEDLANIKGLANALRDQEISPDDIRAKVAHPTAAYVGEAVASSAASVVKDVVGSLKPEPVEPAPTSAPVYEPAPAKPAPKPTQTGLPI